MTEDLTAQRPFDFHDAKALVVGGASGLGLCMAEALLAHGATVVVASRSVDKVQACAQRLAAQYDDRCIGFGVDVTDENSLTNLTGDIKAKIGPTLNIVINAAGTNIRNPIEKISLGEWEGIQRVNSTGGFLLARTMFPFLKEARWARLIQIASLFASRSFPLRVSYAASKGALLQLTRTLAIEWAPYGITVNSISPGPFLTEINRPVLDNPENYRKFCENIPLGRFGEPHEIVTSCLFLASRSSSYVTGADIAIDGGWSVT